MLDEAPEVLIYSAIEGFETKPDVDSIARINELGTRVSQRWQDEEKRAQDAVTRLENELSAVKAEVDVLRRPTKEVFDQLRLAEEVGSKNTGPGGPKLPESTEKDVFSLINEHTANLDNKKIALAKQLSEIESRILQMQSTEMELTRREEELNEQKASALAINTNANLNLATMKIMLFKKFGIHIEESETGENDKIVIFSDRKSDPAKVLDVDPKFLDYFISNYIWEQVGSTEE